MYITVCVCVRAVQGLCTRQLPTVCAMAAIRFFILLIALNCLVSAALAAAQDSCSEEDRIRASQAFSGHPWMTAQVCAPAAP